MRWSSSVCAPTAPRSWSPSPTATGSRRVLGRPAARLRPPRDARPGAGRRRRRARVLGGAARGVPRDPASSGAGCTRSPTSSTPCRSRRSPRAKKMLAEIRDAEDRDHAAPPRSTRSPTSSAPSGPRRSPRSSTTLDPLLAFYDFPAEHWIHLKTTNPIESTFATVRLRTKVTKGPGSRAAGLAMAFKLIEAAQDRWRAVNGPHLVALVRAGATFDKGVLIERPDDRSTTRQRPNDHDPQVLTIPRLAVVPGDGLTGPLPPGDPPELADAGVALVGARRRGQGGHAGRSAVEQGGGEDAEVLQGRDRGSRRGVPVEDPRPRREAGGGPAVLDQRLADLDGAVGHAERLEQPGPHQVGVVEAGGGGRGLTGCGGAQRRVGERPAGGEPPAPDLPHRLSEVGVDPVAAGRRRPGGAPQGGGPEVGIAGAVGDQLADADGPGG